MRWKTLGLPVVILSEGPFWAQCRAWSCLSITSHGLGISRPRCTQKPSPWPPPHAAHRFQSTRVPEARWRYG